MTAQDMAHLKLSRHGEQWRLKKRIPEDVRAHYGCRGFVTFSTKTADLDEARAECARFLADFAAEVQSIRRLSSGASEEPVKGAPLALSPQQIGAILADEATRYKLELLAADESLGFLNQRPTPADGQSVTRRAGFLGIDEAQARAAYFDCEEDALGHFTGLGLRRLKVAGVAAGAGVEVPENVSRAVGGAFARAALEVLEVIRRRVSYELDATPNPSPRASLPPAEDAHVPPPKMHRLSETLADWQTFTKPSPGTVTIYTAAVKLFEGKYPDRYAETITEDDMKAFVRGRMDEGKSPATIKKECAIIRALLARAVKAKWRADNPAADVELPKESRDRKRRGYKPAELAAVFGAGVFTNGDRPQRGKGEAAFWLPLLAVFTGARREELAQLATDRVRAEAGVPYLAIDPLDEDGKLKTDESRRAVPLHRELIRLGFLEFVEDRRRAGGGHLFPLLNPNKLNQYGAAWGSWWSAYIRTVTGIDDATISPMHSFRHSVITDLRQQRIREDEERQILGHTDRDGRGAQKDSHDGYGEHLVPTLAKVINLISHRGLDLSGVKPYVSRFKKPGG